MIIKQKNDIETLKSKVEIHVKHQIPIDINVLFYERFYTGGNFFKNAIMRCPLKPKNLDGGLSDIYTCSLFIYDYEVLKKFITNGIKLKDVGLQRLLRQPSFKTLKFLIKEDSSILDQVVNLNSGFLSVSIQRQKFLKGVSM